MNIHSVWRGSRTDNWKILFWYLYDPLKFWNCIICKMFFHELLSGFIMVKSSGWKMCIIFDGTRKFVVHCSLKQCSVLLQDSFKNFVRMCRLVRWCIFFEFDESTKQLEPVRKNKLIVYILLENSLIRFWFECFVSALQRCNTCSQQSYLSGKYYISLIF